MIHRGDIVIVRFPYAGGSGSKNRPGLVVQCDENNGKLRNTIIAAISSNIRLATTEPSQLLIDPSTSEGKQSGLAFPSAVKCENLFTIAQSEIHKTIGRLSPSTMQQIDDRLKSALGLT